MKKRLFGRKGSITIFLCIILSAIILLESVYISGAYQRKREVLITEAVSHQVEQALSQFDRDILDWYGLYAIKEVKEGTAVFKSMTASLKDASYAYEMTHPFDNDCLKDCISDYMRLRGLAFEGNGILDRLGISISKIRGSNNTGGDGISSWLPTFKSMLGNKKYVKTILDKLKDTIRDVGLGEKIDKFNSFVDSARMVWEEKSSAVIEYGDSSTTISMFDPSSISGLTNLFDKYMDADLPGFIDRMIMNEYATFQFDSRLTNIITDNGAVPETNMIGIPFDKMHSGNHSDLEFLLVGSDSESTNQFAVSSLLLGMRLLLDMGSFLMDEAKKQTAFVIAEVMTLIIALVSLGTVIIDPFTIQYVILFIMAYIQAWTDVVKLVNGMSVPLFYNDTFPSVGRLTDTSYRDYFRIALLFVPEEWLLIRMRYVIQRDAGATLYTGIKGTGKLQDSEYQVERRYELYENH
ncbi:MAG: hypothetical protein IKD90_03710 [Clostridiales bacterium]|nr:hypothetical protein [Clostridiales bacterium]